MDAPVLLSHMLRIVLLYWALRVSPVAATVSYDSRSLLVDGQRKILISGSIHYPRSTPEMWPDLIQKAKDGGLDVIQTYVFWNGHEPTQGNYNFEGQYDLVRFIKVVQQKGLYVHLRIGPYVCAEWNFGGFPVWLKYVPGIAFRTDNGPFKAAMHKFTTKIVNMMKAEKLFEPQGGPIILSQIENEYDTVESGLGAAGKSYVKWAANMAVNLQTGVPWVMCKGEDAPDPVINTCSAFYCQGFIPNSSKKPKLWTEAWSGWFTAFGDPVPYRPVQDLAYGVARFIQNGGAFVNYYMYHGGTNFGRTAGGPFIATSYDYDAPIDEYGLLRQPKWGHLRDLHGAIKKCEPALVSANPRVTYLGSNQEAHVFESKSGCAAFLSNHDPNYSVKVTFRKGLYELPPWSISILPDCKKETFNTARVSAPSIQMKMNPVNVGSLSWQSYSEGIPSALDHDAVPMGGLWEQINVTRDNSDYLWYLTTVNIKPSDLKGGQNPTLTVMSAGHALHVFINGNCQAGTAYGSAENPKLTFQKSVPLTVGTNRISLLSVSMGLSNIGFRFETWNVGVLGPVTLGTQDLTKQKWSYKIGLKGESSSFYSSMVGWPKGSSFTQNQPLTWYKTSFIAPKGSDPLALDMNTMRKGQMWINGVSIGRYWPAYTARGSCTDDNNCNYAGTYDEKKCKSNCGEPSQRWYHIPRSWLKPTGNSLVVFEEMGGNPAGITLVTRTT